MRRRVWNGKAYFTCMNSMQDSDTECAVGEHYAEDELERVAFNAIKLFIQFAEQEQSQRKQAAEKRKSDVDKAKRLQSQAEQLKAAKLRLYKKYAADEISRESYLKAKGELDGTLAENEKEVKEAMPDFPESEVDTRLIEVCNSSKGVEKLTHDLAHAFIKSVYVYPEDRVEIEWKFSKLDGIYKKIKNFFSYYLTQADLSRFGREHVTMDYYLEFVFPEMNVRYIAVNDNEDTNNGLSDFVPFKNLFNEFMAKDTSRKVKAALHAKFAAGERTFTTAPLGYMRHPENKNKLAVDPDTSWIIEKIFDLAVHGAGAGKITKILIQEKIPTSGYINYKKYGQFAKIYENAPAEKAYAWNIRAVSDILKDETYIGNSVHGKQTNVSYKNKKSIRRPESEWFRVENTHEAIISKDVFNQVQKQIASRRRPMKSGKTQIFAGLVKCADCGWSMSYAERAYKTCSTGFFNCSQFRKLGKVGGRCSAHYIRYDVLYAYVLARLQDWIYQAHTDEKELLNRLLKTSDKESAKAYKKQSAEFAKAEKRKVEVDRLFVKLYEDWSSGRITEYNFKMLSQKYQAEQQELIEKIDRLKTELASEKQTTADAEKWIALIKQYSNPTELTAEMLNTLIEKIVVHEAVKDSDGTRTQEIEIFYRFVGKID